MRRGEVGWLVAEVRGLPRDLRDATLVAKRCLGSFSAGRPWESRSWRDAQLWPHVSDESSSRPQCRRIPIAPMHPVRISLLHESDPNLQEQGWHR